MDVVVRAGQADQAALQQAQILWDYLKLDQPLRKSDCLIAMGSHDLRVAEYAAQLMLESWAPLLVCSGGLGRLTKGIWQEPEGQKFAQIAMYAGVPGEQVLIEDKSSNTSENLLFSRELLEQKGLQISSAILVHKPYMERRAIATAGAVWHELDCIAAAPAISFDGYPTEEIPVEEVIQIMIGDFQRIIVYAEKGFQTRQKIPLEVMSAFQILVHQGFDRYLIEDINQTIDE